MEQSSGGTDRFITTLSIGYKAIFEASIEKDYAIFVPEDNCLPKIMDQLFFQEHILIPSAYHAGKYQTLNGNHYTLTPDRILKCTFGNSIEAILLSEEICYRENGKSYHRCRINNILDPRYYKANFLPQNGIDNKLYITQNDFLHFAEKYLKAKDLGFIMTEIREEMALFKENIILVKGYERDYAKQLHKIAYKMEENLFKDLELPRTLIDELEKTNFIKKILESIIFDEFFEFLFHKLIAFYVNEESDLQKHMLNIKLQNKFIAEDYKMSSDIIDCEFPKSCTHINKINALKTPFEKMEILKTLSTQINTEAMAHIKLSKKQTDFQLNADQLLPILMRIILNSNLDNCLANKLFMEHFVLINCFSNEIGFNFINFVAVLENVKEIKVDEEGVFMVKGKRKISSFLSHLDQDFFIKRVRKKKQKEEGMCKPPVTAYTKQYADHFA